MKNLIKFFKNAFSKFNDTQILVAATVLIWFAIMMIIMCKMLIIPIMLICIALGLFKNLYNKND